MEFAKKYASRSQYKHALEVLLPTGPVYEYLEGRIPNPAYTYVEIANISELEEKDRINTEIGYRRTRLGAKIDLVTRDVKREVFESSELESLYTCIIDWTDDHEIRRLYEEKLLQHAYNALVVLESSKKHHKRAEVENLARGLVILKHPFRLAWKIVLEWKDVEEIGDLDSELLEEYMSLFPEDGLSKVLQGYWKSELSPFPTSWITHEDSEGEDDNAMTSEDRLILMLEGLADCSSSIIARRIMGAYYFHLEEYDGAASIAREAQKKIKIETNLSGLTFLNSINAIDVILGTALVHYQPPRHHPEARLLFDAVLLRKPTQTLALIGVGLVLEEAEDYGEAITFLNLALKQRVDPRIKAEVAWCRFLNGNAETALDELKSCLPDMQGSDPKMRTLRAQTLYRIGVCIWESDKSTTARKARNGAYSKFLAALQADLNFAPAYSRLGIYYADYAKDKNRARRCFQKAVELSGSEVEAAERLADSFAISEEWDIVETVAQRVIEAGKVKPSPGSKKKGFSWPFTALGFVQLNRQAFSNSIVSFQAALRISPNEYHTWVGLGEAYHNSGRYIAASKAFEQAEKVHNNLTHQDTEDIWFCKYMLANVKRELGDYETAVEGYEEVLLSKPSEIVVSAALLQTLVESAQQSVEVGHFRRAVDLAKEAISVGAKLTSQYNASNLWKAVGDACSIFTCVQAYAAEFPIKELQMLLEVNLMSDHEDITNLDKVTLHNLQVQSEVTESSFELIIYASLLAYKRSVQVSSTDVHAHAVAWYNLGWAEYHAYIHGTQSGEALKGSPMRYLKASIRCFKRAIEVEAGNAEFWNSLGVVAVDLSPKVAQHSFIRSLHLNERSPRVWTNLGTFYLMQEDYELANQAFTRAQSADPDYANAWVGQGILARRYEDLNEFGGLSAHAFAIAGSSSIIVKQQYTISAFDLLLSQFPSNGVVNILQPRLALMQLQYQRPSQLAFQHLSSMFAERVADKEGVIENLQKICSAIESEYEATEQETTLLRFLGTKADLGRAQLAQHDYVSAAENAETALNLSADEEPASIIRTKLRLSATLTAGLAYYHQGLMDLALGMFRSALEESEDDPDIICLLVQVLWAKGGDQARTTARDQLLNCIERFPNHLETAIVLGVVTVLDGDLDNIRSFLPDLQGFRTCESLSTRQHRQLSQLLNAIESLRLAETDLDAEWRNEITTAVMLSPSRPDNWTQLSETCQERYPSDMAKAMALRSVSDGCVNANDLCTAFAKTERLDDAQVAVMVAPWMIQGWEAISGV